MCKRLPLKYALGLLYGLALQAGMAHVNQLDLAANACGPASILNSMRQGHGSWNRLDAQVAGADDRAKMKTLINEYGMRRSRILVNRARWTKQGVGASDLADMINDFSREHRGPMVQHESLLIEKNETLDHLRKRLIRQTKSSIKAGVPPIWCLNRMVWRQQSRVGRGWVNMQSHYVVVTALDEDAQSLRVSYIDPWKGMAHQGQVILPKQGMTLPDGRAIHYQADFPQFMVGKDQIRKGETSYVAIVGMIGKW